MKNEKLPTRMGTVAYKLGLRHASFRRFCKLFAVAVDHPYLIDSELSPELAAHLFQFEVFARLYEHDYYRDKSPEHIAHLVGRKSDDVMAVLQKIRPEYFINGVYTPKEKLNLRYLSSFEVDKLLGGNYDFLSYK